jgi:hypothetical protein
VDAVSALLLGAEPDGGAETDDGRLVLLLTTLSDGIVDTSEVTTHTG